MAERSIGMATGAGDGIVGGYPASYMIEKDGHSFGMGMLGTGNFLAPSGAGSTNLVIASGTCYNNGYFYENTTTVTISTSTVTAGTYYIVNRVNNTAGTAGVIASASGTTIPARSVRICVVTIASFALSTDVIIGSVVIGGGGVISSTSQDRQYVATNTQLSRQVHTVIAKTSPGGNQTISTANTPTLMTWSSGLSSPDGIITFDSTNHRLVINNAGLYMIQVNLNLTGTTAGTRALWIKSTQTEFEYVFPHLQTNIGSTGYSQITVCTVQNILKNSGIYVQYESSNTGVIVSTPADFRIVRM